MQAIFDSYTSKHSETAISSPDTWDIRKTMKKQAFYVWTVLYFNKISSFDL